jgi:hypothetical protein
MKKSSLTDVSGMEKHRDRNAGMEKQGRKNRDGKTKTLT